MKDMGRRERRTHRRPMPLLLLLLLAGLSELRGGASFPFSPSMDADVTPRTTVLMKGLLGVQRFRGSSRNYSTLLLEEDSGLLYVGGRGALFALDAANISSPANFTIEWEASSEQKKQCLNKGKDNQTECFNHIRFLQRYNETHLYACGTYAFRPLCGYIDAEHFTFSSGFEEGRDRCPYDPAKGYTALLVDGEMFTASQYEFRSSPDLRRNFPFPTLRTEEAPTRWLLDADFVGSALMKESVNSSVGDDDKIYVFFTERSQEQTTYPSQTRVARVARVCKGDWGGQRTLQRKWTSFLKARMVCSVPDYEIHLNILRSVFVLPGEGARAHTSTLYGVFGLEWRNIKASAVCRYSFSDIQKAFEGSFMEVQDNKWREYSGKLPDPRPGSCITDLHRSKGINSSRDLPDSVLTFARRHPLMAGQVQPLGGGRPLLFKRSVNYVKIAVHAATAADRNVYTVLFLGTDDGWLHRAVEIDGEMHIIEELQLFDKNQPVESMVLSVPLHSVFVGSHSAVVRVPMSACQRYISCYDCIFSRDPYCAWDGRVCVEMSSRPKRTNLIQDMQRGSRGCRNSTGNVLSRRRSVMAGDDVLLQCELRSNLASPRWMLNGRELQGYSVTGSGGYRVGTDGLLILGARPPQAGTYRCFSVENAVWVPVRLYTVKVHTDPSFPAEPTVTSEPTGPPPPPPTTSSSSPSPSPAVSSSSPPDGSGRGPPTSSPTPPSSSSYRHMEAMYVSLVAVLGGLCLVLTVVLLYVTFCTAQGGRGGGPGAGGIPKFSQQGLQVLGGLDSTHSSLFELKTVSSHCNGRQSRRSLSSSRRSLSRSRSTSVPNLEDLMGDGGDFVIGGDGGFFQMVLDGDEDELQLSSPSRTPPPAPPLPPQTSLDHAEYANAEYANGPANNGLSSALPSVLRKMHGGNYVLLTQQADGDTSPLYHSFTDELNRILEKRKHCTQLDPQPDESSI